MTQEQITDTKPSPFHLGEQAVQTRLGVRDIEDWARKVVRNHLPEQHRQFHTSLPFLVVAARDGSGRPWVTLLEGPEGFVRSPDPKTLSIEAKTSPGDALEHAFQDGADLGILGIELATRRRNRVNGRVADNKAGTIQFQVDQSFGNCPQYIRERNWQRDQHNTPGPVRRGGELSHAQIAWIEKADTFFIASGYRGAGENAAFGMDASHRGGERGFVKVTDRQTIVFPDYAGNNHYNTIGNLAQDPRAGYLFIDFESGSLLQVTGTTSIDWDTDRLNDFPGARRLITLNIDEIVELQSAVALRWAADADAVRSLRLVNKVRESDDVTSFVFEARDGGLLAEFEAGQHLPLQVSIPGLAEPVQRTYSLSGSPADERYRVSVKREPQGLVSRFLHDHTAVGDVIDARPPAGDFMLTCTECPLVLISAGVGITPMLSMLHAAAREQADRPIWFLHGAKDGSHHPLADEVTGLAANRPNVSVHTFYSRPGAADRYGTDYDYKGRLNGDVVAGIVRRPDAHYFLCGPTKFMAEMQTALESAGVPPEQIHTESFGPARSDTKEQVTA